MKKKTAHRRRRALAGLAAATAALLLVLGGTLAWQSFRSEAQNNAVGILGVAGGRLHDDYEVVGANYGRDVWELNLTANKDIYVENYEKAAENGRDIFVRLKLYEYMETGEGASELKQIEDPGNPGIMITNPNYASRSAAPLITGADRDNVTTWSPRLPGTDANSDLFRSYWEWGVGGQKSYMPTFNRDNHSEESDTKGAAVNPVALSATETINATAKGGSMPYPDDAGLENYFATNTTYNAPEKYWDATAGSGGDHAVDLADTTHTAKQTQTAAVITMAQWQGAPYNGQPGDYWVVDTDGWYYWANRLTPETATGLLLTNIKLISEPSGGAFYYGINVKSEMATATDWKSTATGEGFYADEDEAPSADAEALLNLITADPPEVQSVVLDQTGAAIATNNNLTLNATVITKNTTDPAWEEVTWSSTPDVGMQLTDTDGVATFTPAVADEGKWVTITATSVKDTTKSASCKVYILAAGESAVVGSDGKVYKNYGDNTFREIKEDGSLGDFICPVNVDQPGGEDDRTNVETNTAGDTRFLGPDPDDSYYIKGPDNKLGTSDDLKVWENPDLDTPLNQDPGLIETYSIVIEQVADTGDGTNTVQQGRQIDYTATVKKSNLKQGERDADNQNVTWALVNGPYAVGTAVSTSSPTPLDIRVIADGAETVAPNRIRLQATAEEGGATQTVDITVSAYVPPEEFTDDAGVVWLKLAEEDGATLIMTKYVYGYGTLYNSSGSWNHLDTVENTLKSALQMFYTGLEEDITDAAVAYKSPLPDVRSEPNASFDAAERAEDGYSHPDTASATPNGSNAIFVLSISEANAYLPTKAARTAYNVSTKEVLAWWVRSPGDLGRSATLVGSAGAVTPYSATYNDQGYRPALWVKSEGL